MLRVLLLVILFLTVVNEAVRFLRDPRGNNTVDYIKTANGYQFSALEEQGVQFESAANSRQNSTEAIPATDSEVSGDLPLDNLKQGPQRLMNNTHTNENVTATNRTANVRYAKLSEPIRSDCDCFIAF